ncbi:MAG: hypothetical protein KC635_15020 [Myxococcales bacterium]|nr:hypothetical protein [Myxococcales bacterium]MCB9733191.1 hypothetical protein [Deltaproteobacteria bacterium]
MEEPANDNREAGVEPANDMVTCFVSGATIPRAEAIPVPLGRGQLVWMQAEFCRDDDPGDRRHR